MPLTPSWFFGAPSPWDWFGDPRQLGPVGSVTINPRDIVDTQRRVMVVDATVRQPV